MKKIIAAFLTAVMLVSLCSCSLTKEGRYNDAVACVTGGEYDKAIEIFEALNGYQDSAKYIMYAKCLRAGESGEYEAAVKSLETLGDFKEASMYIQYYSALSYEAEQKYEDAGEVYDRILLFRDAEERSKQLPDKIIDRDLAEALGYIDTGDGDGLSLLEKVLEKKYSSSDTLLVDKVMDYAKTKYDARDYETAAAVYGCVAEQGHAEAQEAQKAAVYALAEQYVGNGEYTDAKKLIGEYLSDYKGADELCNECDYQLTLQKDASEGSAAAQEVYDAFMALGSYKDSAQRAAAFENLYAEAAEKRENGDFAVAVKLFEQLGTYSDAAAQVFATYYAEGEAKRGQQDWEGARSAFTNAGSYGDAAAQVFATYYAEGEAKREKQDWEGARSAFTNAGSHSDAAAQVFAMYYAEGEAKREKQDWAGAEAAFMAAGSYSDASAQISETKYRQAQVLANDEDYYGALEIFNTIVGYKDVAGLLVNDGNLSAAARELKWQIGNTVTFGTYPQTESGNDDTPIEWLVLARDGDKALVISRYALDCVRFNTMYVTNGAWENSTLRKWLNDEFFGMAFTAEEKENIVGSEVTAEKNPNYSANPGKDTTDSVFLLSIAEVGTYFGDDASRRCAPTDYAVKNGASVSGDTADGQASCGWWLRSPGYDSSYASFVRRDGSVDYFGFIVSYGNNGVRPCMWVRLF